VIGENRTFCGAEDHLRRHGVELEVLDDPECVQLMREFIQNRPELWHEDIGEPEPDSHKDATPSLSRAWSRC
jgi:cytosine deaminase